MTNVIAVKNRTPGRRWLIGSALAVAAACTITLPKAARADEITLPDMPGNVAVVEEGNVPYLVGHAIGTQNYVCLPTSTGVAFKLFTPEATLLNDDEGQIITHFFSPNPDEQPNVDPAVNATGTVRAAWQHSHDGSTFWGVATPDHVSTDARFVDPNAIPWVLLSRAGVENGFGGGDFLTKTTFVQRLSTRGGKAPSTGCLSAADIGHFAFVPYTADYFFYKKVR